MSDPPNYFDARIASRTRTYWPHLFDPAVVDPCVEFLATLAGAGPALEFGVGTGRIAIPLAARGVPVHGIDLSPDMVAVLQHEPGGEKVEVTVGDIASTTGPDVDTPFTLVYLLRNTLANLTTQDAQVACFENAAAQLAPTGTFVVELYVPQLRRLPPGQTVHPFEVTPGHVGFDEYEPATQTSTSHHFWFVDGAVESFAAPFRYAWPSELDLMARLAGLRLRERWADWDRSPFTSESDSHVSVYEKPA
jgi:hypothetical protein